MEYVDQYIEKFKKVKAIKEKYGLNVDDIDDTVQSMKEYRVTTPVVGNFSTGKSSLINAVIGRPLLGVEITPETAVPTEVYYGNDNVYQYSKAGCIRRKIEDLPLRDLTIKDTDLLRIEVNNEFLSEIPSVSIVDLPGFDTSIELHNKAIDQYWPNSLAYLLVVSSDEPVLKESILDLMKELKSHDIPVYVVLTKCNRLSDEEIKECVSLLKETVSKALELDDIPVACVDSYGNVKVDEIKDILREIQTQTGDIFINKYSRLLAITARYAEVYLLERIDKSKLSSSELEQEQEKILKNIRDLEDKIEKEKNIFKDQADICIKAIRERITNNLLANQTTISVMLENGADITDKINYIVRNAVTVGIRTEFEPKLQKYVEHIASAINVEFPENDATMLNIKNFTSDNIVTTVSRTALPVALASVGAVLLSIPGGIIAAIVGVVGDVILNVKSSAKKKREIDKAAEQVVTTVAKQAADSVETEIGNYIKGVNQQIENDVLKQREVLSKSLDDVRKDLEYEELSKSSEIDDLTRDLLVIQSITK
jgi:GTPase SAR1 family protein